MKIIKKVRSILLNYQTIRMIDLFSRIALANFSFNSRLIFSKKKIFLLYGGLGDCISWLIFDTGNSDNTIFAIPDKYKKIIDQLPVQTKIHYYKNFYKLIFDLRDKFSECSFIYTSPILELKIINALSGLKNGGGFTKNFKSIHMPNNVINLTDSQYNNYYTKRKLLLENILELEIKNINNYQHKFNIAHKDKNINVVLSIEKNSNWKAEKISADEIIKIIKIINFKFNEPIIRLVGLKRRNDINQIKSLYSNFYNITGQTDSAELIDLIKNSDLIISLESGIVHLANFFFKPVLVLQTYTDAINFTLCNSHIVQNNINCSPCIKINHYPIDIYPPICKYNFKCHEGLANNLENEIINIFV